MKTALITCWKNKWLVGLLIAAFLLRIWQLNTDLLFHRDQGLHSLAIWRIWHDKKLSLLGPPSDTDGLTHAPIYYWLMLPAYALSGGDPVFASLFQITLEVLSLPLFFLVIKKLFNPRTAWLTLILYTFSYGLVSFSRWLVNVTPILPFSHLLLYLLVFFPRPLLTGLVAGIITQLDAAIGVFLLPFLLWFHRKLAAVPSLLIGFFLPALPLFVFELRHDFVLTRAITRFSQTTGRGLDFSLSTLVTNLDVFLTELTKFAAHPYYLPVALFFGLGLYRLRKNPSRSLVLSYLSIPFLALGFFQRGAIGFFFIALLPLALAVTVYGLQTLSARLSLPLIALLLILNLRQLPLIYRPTNALIPIGNANIITIQDRKNIIDWIYQKAQGQPFAVWFYTIPYFQEEVWDYMFLWYGQSKYGYLPEKTSGFSPNDLVTSKYFFAVWEPEWDPSLWPRLNQWRAKVELNFGPPQQRFSNHDLNVQLHRLK